MDKIAKTLMLTTKCGAGCSHCPFGSSEMEHRFLSLEKVKSVLKNFTEKMIVISGGEPFEHPFIEQVLMMDLEKDKCFRIATGGYLNLEPWLPLLKWHPNFNGISMGTDVISSRCSNGIHQEMWRKNVGLLNENGIPYSLTMTLGNDLESLEILKGKISDLKPNPQFIYLRVPSCDLTSELKNEVRKVFPELSVIYDELKQ